MEKNVQLNHDDTNLQPVSTTEVITDKKEDFPLDTMLVGIWDTLKWMSGTLKPLERAIASAGDSGVGFVKKIKLAFPWGYFILSGNIYIGFGKADSAPVNDVVKVVLPGIPNENVVLMPGVIPLVFLTNTFDAISSAGSPAFLYTVRKDSANNVCNLEKEFWYVKKNADGTNNAAGSVRYLVIGQVKSYT
jgi:hypothetical protein